MKDSWSDVKLHNHSLTDSLGNLNRFIPWHNTGTWRLNCCEYFESMKCNESGRWFELEDYLAVFDPLRLHGVHCYHLASISRQGCTESRCKLRNMPYFCYSRKHVSHFTPCVNQRICHISIYILCKHPV